MLVELFDSPFCQQLGLVLMHFIWQGAALALVAGLLLLATWRAAPAVRYLVLLVMLTLMAASPAITFFAVGNSGAPAAVTAPPIQPPTALFSDKRTARGPSYPSTVSTRIPPKDNASTPAPPTASAVTATINDVWPNWRQNFRRLGFWLSDRLELAVATWLIGVLLMSLRLLAGLAYVERLRRYAAQAVAPRIEEITSQLVGKLAVCFPVQVLESTVAQVPTVIGWLRPVILLPGSMLSGLTPRQLEAILAHELAHVRRHDYLVNMLQMIVETLLFYHPAVWWLSKRIRVEREHCCDDLAIYALGDALVYIKSLAKAESLCSSGPQIVLNFTGGLLMHRLSRLTATSVPKTKVTFPWQAGAAAIGILTLTFLCLRLAPLHPRTERFAGTSSYELVSLSNAADHLSGASRFPVISTNGRYVAFCSRASDLVGDDTNERSDVFVSDLQTGRIERVSVNNAGQQGDDHSGWLDYANFDNPDASEYPLPPSISADGRYVAFMSRATNLVPNDKNRTFDIFVRDRQTGTTERVSVSSTGAEAYDLSYMPQITADGRLVFFFSRATNLALGDNGGKDCLFVHNRQTGSTQQVTVTLAGIRRPVAADKLDNIYYPFSKFAISADSRFVTWQDNQMFYLLDRQTGAGRLITKQITTSPTHFLFKDLSMSADGRYVCFQTVVFSKTARQSDACIYDRMTDKLELIYMTPPQNNEISYQSPVVSPDGTTVFFLQYIMTGRVASSPYLVKYERATKAVQRKVLPCPSGELGSISVQPSISGTGKSLALTVRQAPESNVFDIFACDPDSGSIAPISICRGNIPANIYIQCQQGSAQMDAMFYSDLLRPTWSKGITTAVVMFSCVTG